MPQFSFDSLVDMTLDLDVEFSNTTFNRKQNALIVDARARNVGELGIDAPLLMVLENFENPTQGTANADGYIPEGDPYYTFVHEFLGLSSVAAGQQSPIRTLAFTNPLRENVFFDYFWLGPENRAPIFVNFPPTSAVVARAYRHTAIAQDPEDQPVSYALGEGPFEMSIDPASGEIDWTPTTSDIGVHNVTLIARDDRRARRVTIFHQVRPSGKPPTAVHVRPITEILPGGVRISSPRDGSRRRC
jgi:hypothetical protein